MDIKVLQDFQAAAIQLQSLKFAQKSALKHQEHTPLLLDFALVAEAEVERAIERNHLLKLLLVLLTLIATEKAVLLLYLIDVILDFDVLTLLQAFWVL